MFEGAGYMNDSIADEPQQLTNSVSVGGDDKNKSIAAVSVSQICKLTRPNEGLIINGKKIYHVNIVAFVYEIVDKNPQKIHLTLDDYTSGGPLEMSHIIGDSGTPDDMDVYNENVQGHIDDNQPRSLDSLTVGDYVRCIGVVKFTQDKPNLVAYNVRIIEDPNEVTGHICEVIRDSMYYERLQKHNGNFGAFDEKKPLAPQQQLQMSRDEFGKLSNRDKHVLKFLKEKATTDRGVHLDEICANLKAFPRDEVVASLNLLSTEGLCWVGDSEDLWCVNNAD